MYYCIKYTSELFEISCLDNYLKAFETNNNYRTIGITDSYGLDEDSKNKWTFSLAERLFDDSFKYKFEHTLDINKLKSIQINRLMM